MNWTEFWIFFFTVKFMNIIKTDLQIFATYELNIDDHFNKL